MGKVVLGSVVGAVDVTTWCLARAWVIDCLRL